MELPSGIKRSIGNQAITKGDIEGQLKFYAWDVVTPCMGTSCPAYMECSFSGKEDVDTIIRKREEGIELSIPCCQLMKSYLTSIVDIIFRNYAEELTEAQLYRIGMGLIPLYRQLCRFKIAELGLMSVLYVNATGNPAIHPLMKEIREQIIAIERMWITIGLHKIDQLEIEKDRINPYDAMAKEAQKKLKSRTEARSI
jgi:hypothetical protein